MDTPVPQAQTAVWAWRQCAHPGSHLLHGKFPNPLSAPGTRFPKPFPWACLGMLVYSLVMASLMAGWPFSSSAPFFAGAILQGPGRIGKQRLFLIQAFLSQQRKPQLPSQPPQPHPPHLSLDCTDLYFSSRLAHPAFTPAAIRLRLQGPAPQWLSVNTMTSLSTMPLQPAVWLPCPSPTPGCWARRTMSHNHRSSEPLHSGYPASQCCPAIPQHSGQARPATAWCKMGQ